MLLLLGERLEDRVDGVLGDQCVFLFFVTGGRFPNRTDRDFPPNPRGRSLGHQCRPWDRIE